MFWSDFNYFKILNVTKKNVKKKKVPYEHEKQNALLVRAKTLCLVLSQVYLVHYVLLLCVSCTSLPILHMTPLSAVFKLMRTI